MRTGAILLAIVIAVFLVRVEHTGVRIDQLEPVETVYVRIKEGNVQLETDTGAKGIGNSLEKAIENLHTSTASKVFLDTARYLLVETDAEALLAPLSSFLRPNTVVCRFRGNGTLEEVTQYLKTHQPSTTILHLLVSGQGMPTLYYQEGRGQLVK